MSDDWKVKSLHISPKYESISAELEGPNEASLKIRPDLPTDWRQKTLGEVEELAFAEAKKLYPR